MGWNYTYTAVVAITAISMISATTRLADRSACTLGSMSEIVKKRHRGDGDSCRNKTCAPSQTGSLNTDGPGLCLDAFTVALNEACSGQMWFGSTKNLQLASLQFCVVCRDVASWHILIKTGTPRRIWAPAEAVDDPPGRQQAAVTRVPALRARVVTWELPTLPQDLFENFELVKGLKWFIFGGEFNNDGVHALVFPEKLERLVFGHQFDQPVDGISWSESLQELTFGWSFNQAIDRVAWPRSLQQLTFGYLFDKPIANVLKPSVLQYAAFVGGFNQEIENMKRPPPLKRLTFGGAFNQPINKVVWPPSLQQLTFGNCFDQPIDKAVWPVSLRRLTFKSHFNQPIDEVKWPGGLEQLTFGYYFDQLISKVVWPNSLRRLTFGACFDWPIEEVVWPPFLEDLAFGFEFNQVIDKVVWPTSLQQLTFGACFNQAVDKVVWPTSLQYLTLGCVFNHSLQGVKRWPSALAELTLLFYPSRNYEHSLAGIAWPTSLKRLTVGCRLGSEAIALPSGVEICNYCQYADCYSTGAYRCWYHSGLL